MDINQRIEMADENLTNSDFLPSPTIIKVIGVGNGGCNAVNRMIEEGLSGVSFIAMNTDAQQLSRSKADIKVVLGKDITGGMGAGTDPEKGAEAARRDEKKIAAMLEGADLVFVASGFGGGTGTGASPIIASIAKASGALTIGVVTKPFEDEGRLKMTRAEKGIEQMSGGVDSLVVIPNENLNGMIDENITFEESFRVVDDILHQAVQGISNIINETGEGINVDFADVQTMIKNSNGRAHLGIGCGKGEKRTEKAVTNALNNPLLDVENIRNASGILANIVCPKDFARREYVEAMKIISHYASEDANKKIGVCQKEDMVDEVRVTVIATGFEHGKNIQNETNDIDDNDDSTSKDIPTSESSSSTVNTSSTNSSNTNNIVDSSLSNTKQVLDKIKKEEAPSLLPKDEEEAKAKTENKEEKKEEPKSAPVDVLSKSNNEKVLDEMDIDVDFEAKQNAQNIQQREPQAQATKVQNREDDRDIQEAINIANSIKNSPSRNYENGANANYSNNASPATQPPMQAQVQMPPQVQSQQPQYQNIEPTPAANNTHESVANSDHVLEPQYQSGAYNNNNNNNTYGNTNNVAHAVEQPPINNAEYREPAQAANIVPQNVSQIAEPRLIDGGHDNRYTNESLTNIAPSANKHESADSSNYSVEVSPTEELSKHTNLFDINEHEMYDDTDIEKPAFLRREIQTKK